MYKILGADQKEYGPVSAEQLIQWIWEGRADAGTKVQREGTTEWVPMAALPEFASALSSKGRKTIDATVPPSASATAADAIVSQVLARDHVLDPMHCIGRSWDLVIKNFWLLVGATFVIHLIQAALPILAGVLQGGLFLLFLKIIRGRKGEFGDAFAGFSDLFFQLFLVGLVAEILTGLGLLCCVIPGIILCVLWLFAIPLAADKRLDFWPAMEASRKIIAPHWWPFFLLILLNLLVLFAGVLVCCVGVYVASPIVMGALAYAYEDIVGSTASTPAQPR